MKVNKLINLTVRFWRLIDPNYQIQSPYDPITSLLPITSFTHLLAVGFTGYGLVLGQMSY